MTNNSASALDLLVFCFILCYNLLSNLLAFIHLIRRQVMEEKKQYVTPEIVFETDLEVKAGSPLGGPIDPIELFPGSGE